MAEVLDVWIGGHYAGELTQYDAGAVGFAYDDAYRASPHTPALSVSMPKTLTAHPPEVVEPWIDNLLPDNDTLRERWAARFDERRASAFNLLRHMGLDCAGAVQVVPHGVFPDDAAGEVPLTEEDIHDALAALRHDESAWTFGEHGGRYSLGGAQGKFAAARAGDGWALPTGRAPSTHVFKVGIPHREHSVLAEYVTMRAASRLGIGVVDTDLLRFGDEVALVSQRFDRVTGPDGRTLRIHQEDLCQALGVSRHRKYESDGGPGLAQIGGLVNTAIDPRDRAGARQLLTQAIAFNWVAAGTDAHAKNFALAHVGPRVLLAPLYDLTSAALLERAPELRHKAKLAMKVGGEYRLGQIEARHLERAAVAIGAA
ncbi:MAG: HipA domain-containing protein, partial [Nocardioidaceae bacterium]